MLSKEESIELLLEKSQKALKTAKGKEAIMKSFMFQILN
jgi:hypothetical protein